MGFWPFVLCRLIVVEVFTKVVPRHGGPHGISMRPVSLFVLRSAVVNVGTVLARKKEVGWGPAAVGRREETGE